MSNRRKMTMVLEALDKYSKPFQDAAKATKKYNKLAEKVSKSQRDINRKLADVSSYKKLQKEIDETSYQMKIAARRSVELAKKINKAERPTAALKAEFKAAQKAEDKLNQSHARQVTNLNKLQKELTDAKVDTNNLEGATKKLEDQYSSLSRQAKLGRVADRVKSFTGNAVKKSAAFAKKTAIRGAVGGIGLAWLFKREFIDTAAEFERFQTMLETTEGSKKAAQKAMDWVSDFAAKTPFELAEVTESFVKLRAYGLEPTNGLLKTLGDTGAAMGKPVMQAVEAIADAITGENERLKEFGIKAAKSGGQIVYEYTNKLGETMTKTVDASNRKMIQSTLEAIWNEKYEGSMRRLSGTWEGMMSNIKDQWARFKILVMEAGIFDRMKQGLSDVLDKINEMAKNGELQKKAEQFGNFLSGTFEQAKDAALLIISLVKKALKLVSAINKFFGLDDEEGDSDKVARISSATARRRSRNNIDPNYQPDFLKKPTSVVKIDSGRSQRRTASNAGQTINDNSTQNITINAPNANAKEVADELDRRQSRQRRRRTYD